MLHSKDLGRLSKILAYSWQWVVGYVAKTILTISTYIKNFKQPTKHKSKHNIEKHCKFPTM